MASKDFILDLRDLFEQKKHTFAIFAVEWAKKKRNANVLVYHNINDRESVGALVESMQQSIEHFPSKDFSTEKDPNNFVYYYVDKLKSQKFDFFIFDATKNKKKINVFGSIQSQDAGNCLGQVFETSIPEIMDSLEPPRRKSSKKKT